MLDQIDLFTIYSQRFINIDSDSENDNILKNDNGSNIFPFFGKIIKEPIESDEESKTKNIDFRDKKEKEEKSPFVVNKQKKRGKEKKKVNIRTHKPDASDNCLRKINVHYLSFIVSFLNDILAKLQYGKKFCKLQYKFKKTIKKKEINSLKSKNIGQILSNNISDKYKYKDTDYNQKILNQIKNKNKVLINILSENYLELFKKFYFKSKNIINLGEYGLDKTIILSDKVKMFKDLLLKYGMNDKSFNRNMLKCIKRNFISDLIFLVN